MAEGSWACLRKCVGAGFYAFGFPLQFSNNLEEAIAKEISYSYAFSRA